VAALSWAATSCRALLTSRARGVRTPQMRGDLFEPPVYISGTAHSGQNQLLPEPIVGCSMNVDSQGWVTAAGS